MSISPEELQTRLAAIVETSDDAIISKNLQGIIQSWNTAAERIFGYTSAEMVGKPITIIIPSDRQYEEPAILDRLKKGERVDHFQTIRMRKDGALLNLSVTISPIKDHTGKVVGASKIARDITDYLRLQAERDELLLAERSARGEAERVNRMKDEFISTLSHELRTPLNAILGWSQLITRSKADPETLQEGMAVIERNAKAQTQLIEDLLDMGRIASGKVRISVQPVDLISVINAALEAVKPSADAKEIALTQILDPRAAQISGDPTRLQQVIWNLLTNAIKFTPTGGKVQVLLERTHSSIKITVTDTGRGMKPEFLPYVFDRFRQADSSTTREHGGLGIGLSIVKNLVELHGGTVRVKSPGEGQGAAFTIDLPLLSNKRSREPEKASTPAPVDSVKMCEAISLRGITVLVVDDEQDARELIVRLLENCDASVLACDSAAVALEMMKNACPDVLVSDIGMPHMDGYEFIRAVRKLPHHQCGKIPALALTAFARPEDRTRTLMAGYQIHVAKPVDAQELITTVASLAGRTG